MADEFAREARSRQDPARISEAVTFSGGTYLPSFVPTGITVAVAGVIKGLLLDDTGTPRDYGVGVGMNALRFKSITESGTTATGLVVVRG